MENTVPIYQESLASISKCHCDEEKNRDKEERLTIIGLRSEKTWRRTNKMQAI